MAHWETFESRLEVTADLVTATGLRVGRGGEAAEPPATDLPVLKDAAGRPYLPGSSLRGALRSHMERFVRALEVPPRDGRGACNPVQEGEWCVKADQVRAWKQEARQRGGSDSWFSDQIWRSSCRVCRVFGSPWLASRVRIADLYVDGEARVEIRPGVSIDRDKGTVKNLYDFEAVPAGVRFRLVLTAENLDPEETGMIWLGLRELERGHIHLGGFKGRGLGQVALENLSVRGVATGQRQALRAYLVEGVLAEIPVGTMDGYLEAFARAAVGGA